MLAEALRRTGSKTKRRVVEEALRTLIRLKRPEEIRSLRGKLHGESISTSCGATESWSTTFRIRHGHVRLHADRDFEPMRGHLGLHTR